MKTSVILSLLLLFCCFTGLLYGRDRDSAPIQQDEQLDSAYSAVQQFYVKYITAWLQEDGPNSDKLEVLQKQYVTRRFLDKLQNMDLDYDPFLEAQDCDQSVLDHLRIEKDTTQMNTYWVYLWDNFNKKYKKIKLLLKRDEQTCKIDNILF